MIPAGSSNANDDKSWLIAAEVNALREANNRQSCRGNQAFGLLGSVRDREAAAHIGGDDLFALDHFVDVSLRNVTGVNQQLPGHADRLVFIVSFSI